MKLKATLVAWSLIQSVLILVTFFICLAYPERVATHFNLAGAPNGWMSRSTAILFNCGLEFGAALFLAGGLAAYGLGVP